MINLSIKLLNFDSKSPNIWPFLANIGIIQFITSTPGQNASTYNFVTHIIAASLAIKKH
jgi:hypothetical protein